MPRLPRSSPSYLGNFLKLALQDSGEKDAERQQHKRLGFVQRSPLLQACVWSTFNVSFIGWVFKCGVFFYAAQCHFELGSPINLLNCKLVETSRCLEADLTDILLHLVCNIAFERMDMSGVDFLLTPFCHQSLKNSHILCLAAQDEKPGKFFWIPSKIQRILLQLVLTLLPLCCVVLFCLLKQAGFLWCCWSLHQKKRKAFIPF